MNEISFENPEYYSNRELSWLSFNERVLAEAWDKHIELFERLKFLSITASNLDEFNMIRVASLKDMVHTNYTKPDIAGMTPKEQLRQISGRQHALVKSQYSIYNRSLLPALKSVGLKVIEHHEDLSDVQKEYADRFFMDNVYPVLTPMAMDQARPFPLVRNKSLNIGALICKKDKDGKEERLFATVQVPAGLPRIVKLPAVDGKKRVILLEEVIERNLGRLFLGHKVISAYPYRIMRNADLTIDEDEAADLLAEIQKQLKKRQWGEVIKLEVEEGIDKHLLKVLLKEFDMHDADVYYIPGPLDLTLLSQMYDLKGFEAYKQERYTPAAIADLADTDIFAGIRKKDILLHHPYESFEPVVDFVKTAAADPEVLAIKQTLYRVSGDSPIVKALAGAAENGKQVTVLVELKARFDEENNIVWAKTLEKAGAHVIYGLIGLKTHCKITLVVRKEEDGIRRYVHLGTGNYNDTTAKLYTDMGLFSCDAKIGTDATAVFNMLSGYSEPRNWNKLVLAPLWMKDRFLSMIKREEDNAKKGGKGHIIAKMNSLCDKDIIAALYAASHAGVRIELIVRGICSLKVGIPHVSESITVHSIVGRFLEHSRIFYFYAGGEEEIYLGSADWMPRNLDKRVEIVFPVEEEDNKQKIRRILDIQLADNKKAHILQADGTYEKVDRRGKVGISAQETFCAEAGIHAHTRTEAVPGRLFIPAEPAEEE